MKNITLPWGGNGSALMTVLGGNSCFIGWNNTGNAILDAMEVHSSPAHGNVKQRDQHVVIFNPNPGYHGQDSFTIGSPCRLSPRRSSGMSTRAIL